MPDLSAERIPVIIGIGEYTERPQSPEESLEPRDMMAKALDLANKDCGENALTQIDKLNVIMPMSWKYSDLPAELCKTLGISPKQRDIAEGRSDMAAIVGGEAQYSLVSAQRAGQMPPWSPFAAGGPNWADAPGAIHPLSMSMGLYLPLNIYPLFEAATAAHWGQTPAQADKETAEILSQSSAIAVPNPYSWGPVGMSGEDIATPTPKNRIVSWPYTKSMVASMNVNQSAAIIITSLAKAREMGVSEDQCVFITEGAGANEPADFLARENYYESPAQEAVLKTLKTEQSPIEAAELYSCFPVVPKMARRILGRSTAQASRICDQTLWPAPLQDTAKDRNPLYP